jgi:hypothetical protein
MFRGDRKQDQKHYYGSGWSQRKVSTPCGSGSTALITEIHVCGTISLLLVFSLNMLFKKYNGLSQHLDSSVRFHTNDGLCENLSLCFSCVMLVQSEHTDAPIFISQGTRTPVRTSTMIILPQQAW